MKIGCNTVDFRKHSLEKALQWIVEAGYEYVEVEAKRMIAESRTYMMNTLKQLG